MHMNKKMLVALSLSLALFFPTTVNAAHHPRTDSGTTPVQEIIASFTDEDSRLSNAIREVFDFPVWPGDIAALRKDHLDYDEISIAHGLAYLSGHSVEHILDMRTDQHMGWGRIAKELDVKVSDAVHVTNKVMNRAALENDDHWTDRFFAKEDDDTRDKAQKEHAARQDHSSHKGHEHRQNK